ncbi:hypothetical protein WJX72_012474 [[Myrmecia] bisecta]|uniref:Proteasome assembly chaperone 4 n=1 Tax=[Myrmecia] bisecta TaxID=41462 RepID=A0AAW1PDL8_9CHLO
MVMAEQPQPPNSTSIRQHCFSEEAEGLEEGCTVHFQVVSFHRSLFIWVGVGTPKLASLALAAAHPASACRALPPAATLLRGGADDSSAGLAQKLAQKTGQPVACSINLPPHTPLLQAFIERRLLQELAALALIRGTANMNLAS